MKTVLHTNWIQISIIKNPASFMHVVGQVQLVKKSSESRARDIIEGQLVKGSFKKFAGWIKNNEGSYFWGGGTEEFYRIFNAYCCIFTHSVTLLRVASHFDLP